MLILLLERAVVNTFFFLLRCFLVADYSAQAVVNSILHESFPADPIVGEEDAKDLRGEAGRQMREKVLELANSGLEKALNEDSVCALFCFLSQDSTTKKNAIFDLFIFFTRRSTHRGAAVDTHCGHVFWTRNGRERERKTTVYYLRSSLI